MSSRVTGRSYLGPDDLMDDHPRRISRSIPPRRWNCGLAELACPALEHW